MLVTFPQTRVVLAAAVVGTVIRVRSGNRVEVVKLRVVVREAMAARSQPAVAETVLLISLSRRC